jgi:hypothetical protein
VPSLSDLGSLATAAAVLVAAWQVRRSTLQATTDFEDDLNREYREVMRGLSVAAYLGEAVDDRQFANDYPALVQYIDLSNEQVFLRQAGRVGQITWQSWCEGIEANLDKPAFKRAWQQVKVSANQSFSELRQLESTSFRSDPRSWVSTARRLRRWIAGS